MQQGNYNDAKLYPYGIRNAGHNFKTVKLRFKADIANNLIDRVNINALYYTNVSNKGCRTIYGLLTNNDTYTLMSAVRRAKASRLIAQARELMY